MSEISPAAVLRQISEAVPARCRENIVIIGSLAAGYHFFKNDASRVVQTKDVDCVLEPFHAAVGAGREIARQLLDAGWQRKETGEGKHETPGSASTPEDKLPAVRLYPPSVDLRSKEAWFIELLTVPEPSTKVERNWRRLKLKEGHFGLPAFRYLILTAADPLPAGDLGIRYARPEMMALSNLLHHSRITPTHIEGTDIKRSNKDLGRVLALAYLADLDDYRPWAHVWKTALEKCFPGEWSRLALHAGSGLRELLHSDPDFAQAHQTCITGLLASQKPGIEALRAAGERLVVDACEWLQTAAEEQKASQSRRGSPFVTEDKRLV